MFSELELTPKLPDEQVSVNHRLPARDLRALLYALSLTLDCIALAAGFAIATLVRDEAWLAPGDLSIIVLAIPLFIAFSIAREAQCIETLESRSLGIERALGALVGSAVACVLLIFAINEDEVSRLGFALTFIAGGGCIVVSRLLLDYVFRATMGGKALRTVLLVDGVSVPGQHKMDVIDLGESGLWPDPRHPSMIDKVSRIISDYDRVVVACPDCHRDSWALFLKGSDVGGELLVDNSVTHGAVAIGQCGQRDTLVMSRGPMSLQSRIQKRAMDLALGIPLLILFAPLMLCVALAIRIDSAGPVFFRQTRVGQGSRQFRIFKFRTMRAEASDIDGNRSTGRDDDRITQVGALLRRTSIDELPQLLNVLKGDMSLVGPRPHALGSLAGEALFWEVTESYWLRHALKPGITGLAQVRGFRGSTAKAEDLQNRLKCDLEYLSNWSLKTDIVILFKTLGVVIHKNAF